MYMIFLKGSSGFVGTSVLNYFGTEITLQYKRVDNFKIDLASLVIHLAVKAHDLKKTSESQEYCGKLPQKLKRFKTDVLLIFLTVWVIVSPESQLPFKVFKDLPKRNF